MSPSHGAELAVWILAGIASVIAIARSPKWTAAWWAGIAGFLCNLALVVNHL